MKYMMMMHVAANEPYQIAQWPAEDFKAHIAFMQGFAQRLSEQGVLLQAEGLSAPDQALRVVAGHRGEAVTDGPFAESKEFLAGFWIIEVDSRDQACALAAEVSAAPGPGGRPLKMAIELREVMAAPCSE